MHSYEKRFQVYTTDHYVTYVNTMTEVLNLGRTRDIRFVTEGYADVRDYEGGTEYIRRTTRRLDPKEYTVNAESTKFLQRWKADEKAYALGLDEGYDQIVANTDVSNYDLAAAVVEKVWHLWNYQGVLIAELDLEIVGTAIRDALDQEKMTR